jgi:hypothetical protein
VHYVIPQHLISPGDDVPCPARLPDLSVCGCFLWGYLKSKFFISKPTTIEELKRRIKKAIAAIPEQIIRRVTENRRGSFEQCLRNGGGASE